MSSTPNQNLVHESETQRQYVRAGVPGVLELDTPEGPRRFRLRDLSGGGLAFETKGLAPRPGQTFDGRINLSLEAVTVTVPVRVQICYHDAAAQQAGARFERIGAGEMATLRRVVGAYLGGELIGAGEVLHTLSRNNFTSPRKQLAPPRRRGFLSRFRQLAQTSLIMVLGAGALIYTVHRVNEKLFGANSSAGRVTGPSFQVAMPRDGVFRSLVPADGIVKKGTPIGSFETSMFGLVSAQALEAALTPQQVEQLLGKQIKGTVTSPCDCRVTAVYAADEQYVGKGERLADLAPITFEPYVLARFSFREAERLEPGTPVTLRINGEALARSGTVSQLRGGDDFDKLTDDVVVVVKPELPLPMEMVSRPVQVSAEGNSLLVASRLDKVFALVAGRAEARP